MKVAPLTDEEWWSAVARCFLEFCVRREDNVEDPEAGGMMQSKQENSQQQQRADALRRPHVSRRWLCWLTFDGGVTSNGT